MPQNPTVNKFLSLIGLILLLLVIGFTIFMNISEQEREKEYKSFTQNELDDLWKFEDIETKYKNENKSSVEIRKKIKNKIYSDSSDKKQKVNYSFTVDKVYYYGDLELLSDNEQGESKILGFEVALHYTEKDRSELSDMGHLFTKYQIRSILSSSSDGNFTCIDLRDGRKVFLIKKGANIVSKYYNELIEKAKPVNDSTRVIFPLAIKEIKAKYFETENKQEEKKERINLFAF